MHMYNNGGICAYNVQYTVCIVTYQHMVKHTNIQYSTIPPNVCITDGQY